MDIKIIENGHLIDFPRIGRLQYLAEQKIYLKNNSPKNIIRWFEEFPPVSGTGKLKLGEAYFELKDLNNSKQFKMLSLL